MTFETAMIRHQYGVTHVAVKIATVALCATTAMFLTGFTTTSWTYSEMNTKGRIYYDRLGLWKYCRCFSGNDVTDDVCLCINTVKHFDTAWFRGVQASETIGLGCLLLAMIGAITFILASKHSLMKWVTIGCTICAGVFTTVGVLVYAVKTPEPADLHVSFYVTMTSAVFTFLVAGMMSYGASESQNIARTADNSKLSVVNKIDVSNSTDRRQSKALTSGPTVNAPDATMFSTPQKTATNQTDQTQSITCCHGSSRETTTLFKNEEITNQIPPDLTMFTTVQ